MMGVMADALGDRLNPDERVDELRQELADTKTQLRRPANGQRDPVTGLVPEGVWHLSDSHGLCVQYGSQRYIDLENLNLNAWSRTWTRAEASALVNHLNDTGFRLPQQGAPRVKPQPEHNGCP